MSHMSYSPNSLKGVSYGGLYGGLLWGVLRGMVGVSTIAATGAWAFGNGNYGAVLGVSLWHVDLQGCGIYGLKPQR